MDQQHYIQEIKEKLICAQKKCNFIPRITQKQLKSKRGITQSKIGRDKMKNHGNFVYKQANQLILH